MGIVLHSVFKNTELAGCGGARLKSQHSGGRGRWISEFKASPGLQNEFQDNTEKPCLEK